MYVCMYVCMLTCGFLMQLLFCKKKSLWFIGVEVKNETKLILS